MSLKKITFAVVFAFWGLLLFPRSAFAGGGLVYLDARPNVGTWGDAEGSRMYIVRAFIDPSVSCVNVPITFKFEDPRQGDRISVGSRQQPFIIQGPDFRIVDGRMIYDCTTYAKVISADKTNRYLYAEIGMPDGTTYTSSKVSLNFQIDDPDDRSGDPIQTPWDDTPDDFSLGIVNREQIECPKREIELQWNEIEGMSTYTVYARVAGSGSFQDLLTTADTIGKIIIDSCQDYFVRVEGCFNAIDCEVSGQLYMGRVSPSVTPPPSIPGIGGYLKAIFEQMIAWIKSIFS